MKRISILVCILCVWFIAMAAAQQTRNTLTVSKHAIPTHRIWDAVQKHVRSSSHPMFSSREAVAANTKVWELGSDGTWAELHGVNDFGVAVGWGDVPSGDTRMVGVPIFGPGAGNWFDSGVSSDEFWSGEGVQIANTGLVAGHITGANGDARAYAWIPGHSGGFDLGTLQGDSGSVALAINNSGTLIVGGSYHWLNEDSWWLTPVAWTPKVEWHNGRPVITWVIHKLPTGGLEKPGKVFKGVILNNWSGWGVNDFGQIVGDAWSDNYDEIAVVWNPAAGGQEWKVQQLPHRSSYPIVATHKYTEALAINNRGEIAGDINLGDGWCDSNDVCTALPALWKPAASGSPAWKLTELATLSGTETGWNIAWSINQNGDIVGVSNDANGNSLATHWLTRDPGNPQALGFPGDWSTAIGVNNFGIAVGTYGIGDNPEQAVAVAIH